MTLTINDPLYTVLRLLVEQYREAEAEAEDSLYQAGRLDGIRTALAYINGATDLPIANPIETGMDGWVISIERLLEQARKEPLTC